jgi:hypothetical protein
MSTRHKDLERDVDSIWSYRALAAMTTPKVAATVQATDCRRNAITSATAVFRPTYFA